jgi:hypothetical protein
MQKTQAIQLLGGSISAAAAAIGITYKAVHKWPDTLTPRIADRVTAAISRAKNKRQIAKNSCEIAKNKAVILPSIGSHE